MDCECLTKVERYVSFLSSALASMLHNCQLSVSERTREFCIDPYADVVVTRK
jgi:hypothetical protein